MKSRTHRLAAILAFAFMLATPAAALAQVPSSIGAFVSDGYASGVHVIASSSAFPNFDKGAVYNRYPLAEVQQDASPSSTAHATFSDSGPLAATGGSQYNQSCSAGNPPPPSSVCQNPNNSVPSADSNYPGGPSSAHVDSCGGQSTCPAAQANSDASELGANALGIYSGGAGQPFSGASGESHTYVTSGGVLYVITHSEVQSFVIGNVSISKVVVDTIATATNSSATADARVTVGSVTVNGVPVTITDQGITVQQKSVSCPSTPGGGGGPAPGGPAVPTPPALPSPPALPGDSSGCATSADGTFVKIYAVAPQKSVNGTHGTVGASGLHVIVTQPTPGPGVPQQSTEYVLGEGFADASTGSGSGGFGFPGGGFGFNSGDFGFNGPSGDNGGLSGGNNAAANAAHVIFANRWWPLVLLFLTLEALILGSAAAYVWSRNAPKDDVADEVLSP